MKKDTTQKKKMIPSYAILPLLICVAVNFTVYIGTDKLMEHRNFYDLTLPIDRMVPVIPAFSVIYIGCYLFWIVNYIMITRMNRSHCYRFILADVMSSGMLPSYRTMKYKSPIWGYFHVQKE